MNIKYAEHLQFQPKTKDFSALCEESEFSKLMQIEVNKINAVVIDIQNQVIYKAVMDFAMREGLTDLFIIDEEFVRTALINEFNRRVDNGTVTGKL